MDQHRPGGVRGSVSPGRPEEEMKTDDEGGGGAPGRDRGRPPASRGPRDSADGAQHAPVRAPRARRGGRRDVARSPLRDGASGGAARRGSGGGGSRRAQDQAQEAAQRMGAAASGGASPHRVGGLLRGWSRQACGG